MPVVIFFACLDLERKSSLINKLINKVPHYVEHLFITDYLTGAAYMMPPLVHRAFKPRSRARGVLTPTLRSKISP